MAREIDGFLLSQVYIEEDWLKIHTSFYGFYTGPSQILNSIIDVCNGNYDAA